MKIGGSLRSELGNVLGLRLRCAMPVLLAAAVVALAAGCSWIQPSNQVLADQAQSTTPAGRASPSASAPAASAQPEWVGELGPGVVVTAPAVAAPGDASPAAAVQGYVNAVNAGTLTQACAYFPPSGQSSCDTAMADAPSGSIPTFQGFSLAYVAVDGNEALVGATGMECVANDTPACSSNDDPAAIFSEGLPFSQLWAESIAADASSSSTNSYSLAPCVKVGANWYVYNPGPGGNT